MKEDSDGDDDEEDQAAAKVRRKERKERKLKSAKSEKDSKSSKKKSSNANCPKSDAGETRQNVQHANNRQMWYCWSPTETYLRPLNNCPILGLWNFRIFFYSLFSFTDWILRIGFYGLVFTDWILRIGRWNEPDFFVHFPQLYSWRHNCIVPRCSVPLAPPS